MKSERNLWSAGSVAVAFWFATCGRHITALNHKKETRAGRGGEAPKHYASFLLAFLNRWG